LRFVPPATLHGTGLVHQSSTGLVARIGRVEWEVLRRFDGTNTELVRQRVERECGVRVALRELEAFARHARVIGLVECPESRTVARPRSPRARPGIFFVSSCLRGLSWNIPLWNPERVFAWCASRASFLFHPISIAAGVLIVAAAAVTSAGAAHIQTAPHIPGGVRLAMFLTLLNIISIVHECGHGLALHRWGGHVREIGVRFILGWPCWYCDITESYLLPQLRQRAAVILAGPFVQVVACAGVMLITHGSGTHLVAVHDAAALLGALSILNFFPLVPSDGYYLLTELAGMPNLRADAWSWLASGVARKRMRARLSVVRRMAIAAYAVASAGFVLLVLGRALTLIGQVFIGAGSVSFGTVASALSIVVIAATIFRSRSFIP
jgi:putative peptide zinc metalloprotease protein